MVRSQKSSWKSFVLLTALLAVTATTGCRVRQTQDGKLPEVDVKGGQAPKYDVQPAEVDVKTKKKEITVPDVSVKMPPKDNTQPSDTNKPPQ